MPKRDARKLTVFFILMTPVMSLAKDKSATKTDDTAPTLPEISVTAPAEDSGYNAYSSSAATKTDTPIFQTPQNIQVVPRQVIEDQKTTDLNQSLQNVSSVRWQPSVGAFNGFLIRGFQSFNLYRNGLRTQYTTYDTANLESIEVLKGPASVLYGRSEAGGLINLTTKRPLMTPYYSLEQQIGSYDFYRTIWDATGPLNPQKTLAYRVSGSYQNNQSYRNFIPNEQYQIYGALDWHPSAKTDISFDFEALKRQFREDYGIPAVGRKPAPISIATYLGEPNSPLSEIAKINLGFNLTHRFNQAWTLRNQFLYQFDRNFNFDVTPAPQFDAVALEADNLTLDRNFFHQRDKFTTYALNLNLIGKKTWWNTQHELLVGFDYLNRAEDYNVRGDFLNPDPTLSIDIFNPAYARVPRSSFNAGHLPDTVVSFSKLSEEWYGLYFQDQITLWNKLHILGGGRYDWATVARGDSFTFAGDPGSTPDPSFAKINKSNTVSHTDSAFSPRVGVLYEPRPWLALYGNYTQSFGTNNAKSSGAVGRTLPPEIGTQYEGGIKTRFFEDRLNASLAFFHITKTNLRTPDLSTPDPTDFTTIGEARSQGIEFDIAGQLTEGLSLIGSYAYTDARITHDVAQTTDVDGNVTGTTPGNQGHRLPLVPEHAGSLWLKYAFVKAPVTLALRGLNLGIGVYVASDRQGDKENTFILPGYARLDAMAGYSWKVGLSKITAQLNVRNLLDQRYFDGNDPNSNVAPRLSNLPGIPLTVVGSVRVEF